MPNGKVHHDNTGEKAGQEGEVSQQASFPRDAAHPATGGSAVRAGEPMDDRAHDLAASQEVLYRSGQAGDLLDRLKAQGAFLRNVYRAFSVASDAEASRSYAAEWLLDNFYVVQQALRQVEEDMPGGYYRQLPKLKEGPLQGFPRIYAVAREIAHENNARLDLERVQRFIDTYQQVTPLTMGELWALPTMLRLSAIETLATAVARVADIRLPGSETRPQEMQPAPLGLHPTPAPPQVRGGRPGSLFLRKASRRNLVSELSELPPDTLVANSILSLRALAMQDWKAFFESVSRVEQVLSRDPAEVYSGMDFDTRDRYRKVIEELALVTGQSEIASAETAIQLARQAPTSPPTPLLAGEGGGATLRSRRLLSGGSGPHPPGEAAQLLSGGARPFAPLDAGPPDADLLGKYWADHARVADRPFRLWSDGWRLAARNWRLGADHRPARPGAGGDRGCKPGQLAGYSVAAAARLAQNGFRRRHTGRLPDDGGHSHPVDQPRRSRIFAAPVGAAFLAQCRPSPALCAAHRL